jgi:hypothetical protein
VHHLEEQPAGRAPVSVVVAKARSTEVSSGMKRPWQKPEVRKFRQE